MHNRTSRDGGPILSSPGGQVGASGALRGNNLLAGQGRASVFLSAERSPATGAELQHSGQGLDAPGGGGGKPCAAYSGVSDKAFLVTPRWEVLELAPGVLTPSGIRQALGLPNKTGLEGYKEPIATSSDSVATYSKETCGQWAILGRCSNGHVYAKELLCGREWCSICGQDWSASHQRRFSRMLPKAQQIRSMGYFVIEWPIASREQLRTKRALSDMGKRIKGAFQALGYKRGLRRWHFFGASGYRYNPHLNVLVDGGFLSPRELDGVKVFLRMQLDEPRLIVNYHYRQTVAEKVHSLKYITRATFLSRSWDEELAAGLYNLQNGNYWGRWQDPVVWDLDDLGGSKALGVGGVEFNSLRSLQSNLCPCCGEPLSWTRKKDIRGQALARFGVGSQVVERLGYGALSPGQVEVLHQRIGPGSFAARIAFVQQFRGHDTEADLCSMSIIESPGAVALGAGYWRLPDEVGLKSEFIGGGK